MSGLIPKQLGSRLSLFIFAQLLLLGAVTAVTLVVGFRRTQDSATKESRAGLEAQGRDMLQSFANMQAFIGTLQLTAAAQPAEESARYLAESPDSAQLPGGRRAFDLGTFATSPRGQRYDADPARKTDLVVPPNVALDDSLLRDLGDTAAFDLLFPSVLKPRPSTPGSSNFDPIAIFYIGRSGMTRYYPPAGIVDRLPITLPLDGLFDALGPAKNPARATIWTPFYADDAGRGLVITAYAPVYSGQTLRGAIGMDLAVARLVEQVNQVTPTTSGFAFYMDAEGKLLPSASAPAVQAAIDDRSNVAFAKVLVEMKEGKRGIAEVNFNGRRSAVAYVPFEGVGGSFALLSPVDEITAKAADVTSSIQHEGNVTIGGTLAGMTAIFAIGLVAIILLNRRVILKPLSDLMEGTRAVAHGDFSRIIPVTSEDELGALAGSFNLMTDELRQRRDEIEEKEAQFRNVFESAIDGLGIADPATDRIVEANPAFCEMHGYTHGEIIGMPLVALLDPSAHHLVPRLHAATLADELRSGRVTRVRKDGTTFKADVSMSPFMFGGRKHVLAIVRDATEQVRAYEQLEERVAERTHELSTLLDVSRSVASTLDFHMLTGVVLEQLRSVVEYSRAIIVVMRDGQFHIVDSRGEDVGSRIGEIGRYPKEMIDHLASGQAMIIEDVRGEGEFAEIYRKMVGDELMTRFAHVRSWMMVPIMARQQLLGLLGVSRPEPGKFEARQAALATAFANQVSVALENARLFEQAQDLAALEERQRLARELHDSVSQALYGIALGARTARTLLDRSPEKAIEPVDYVLSLAEAGLAEMRALIFELRPESLATEGLVAALEKQVAVIRARHGIAVDAEFCPEPDAPLALKADLYRVAQEALHNIVKHARAKNVRLRLVQADGTLTLRVDDDGVGFDPDGDFPGHLGLRSMRERSARARGSLTLESVPGSGCRLTAIFPLPISAPG